MDEATRVGADQLQGRIRARRRGRPTPLDAPSASRPAWGRNPPRVARAAAAAATLLALAGCGAGSRVAAATVGAGPAQYRPHSPLTIGYSVYDLQSPYWQSYLQGVQAGAKANHVEVVVADQKSKELGQVAGSADLINQGVSALIVSPVQPAALPATINAAHAAGIPVVIGDVGAIGQYDAYVQSDNQAGGALAATYLVGALKGRPGVKEVGVIGLHSGSTVGDERVAGFQRELSKHPDFRIVSNLAGQDTVVTGFSATQDMLAANPRIVGLFAADDPEAQGASRAMRTAGKQAGKDIVLVGFNGDAPSLDLIASGEQTASVAQDAFGQGELAVRSALQLLHGQQPRFTDVTRRTLEVPVTVVDESNLMKFRAARPGQ